MKTWTKDNKKIKYDYFVNTTGHHLYYKVFINDKPVIDSYNEYGESDEVHKVMSDITDGSIDAHGDEIE